eukprot:s3315_g7.t1
MGLLRWIVVGKYFNWCIRLDYGAEGKLRLVYELATPNQDLKKCIHRFPAAMFAWQVVYNGQSVFHEKPVFICFPENVQLHWSTTLPITAAELTEDDNLEIVVQMAENPMLSLILYYFSADLKTTVAKEDILNRLPHIEYRKAPIPSVPSEFPSEFGCHGGHFSEFRWAKPPEFTFASLRSQGLSECFRSAKACNVSWRAGG